MRKIVRWELGLRQPFSFSAFYIRPAIQAYPAAAELVELAESAK